MTSVLRPYAHPAPDPAIFALRVYPDDKSGIARAVPSDYIDDIDYNDHYIADSAKSIISSAFRLGIRRYMRVLISQPFEVSRTILQAECFAPPPAHISKLRAITYPDQYAPDEDEDDDDETSYFSNIDDSTTNPAARSPSSKHRKHHSDSRSNQNYDYRIAQHEPYISSVANALWTANGPWGIWKATHISYMQGIMDSVLCAWVSGLASAMFGIPDPTVIGILETTRPFALIINRVLSKLASTLLLMPVDLIRTRIILSPVQDHPRSFLKSLNALPSLLCPSSLLLPAAFHSAIATAFTPISLYLLRSNFHMDPVVYPGLYRLAHLISSLTESIFRLPMETVLRRAQVSHLFEVYNSTPEGREKIYDCTGIMTLSTTGSITGPSVGFRTVVPVLPVYGGILPSLWELVRYESAAGGSKLETLWRGWRASAIGIISFWALETVSDDKNDLEIAEI
ncbi:hypothetical protein CANCADRAFT_32220 [Tortispora caseinolytica NRRL Y-17796]|uniref:Mitochondrial fusion and transport protein UGO1 n=1 Tax=Tortispora caseinolytica NRRL Y-17796 TaxID=767744 RepID=A0A1E4TAE9_9ASCO|nr:hypothetical protein CANCADRAFT_32220 [Tortispora caseinolytica NRRL Y-17796]